MSKTKLAIAYPKVSLKAKLHGKYAKAGAELKKTKKLNLY